MKAHTYAADLPPGTILESTAIGSGGVPETFHVRGVECGHRGWSHCFIASRVVGEEHDDDITRVCKFCVQLLAKKTNKARNGETQMIHVIIREDNILVHRIFAHTHQEAVEQYEVFAEARDEELQEEQTDD
jgi:hypothetical protein